MFPSIAHSYMRLPWPAVLMVLGNMSRRYTMARHWLGPGSNAAGERIELN